MRQTIRYVCAALASAAVISSVTPASAQAVGQSAAPPPNVRRISVEDAVRMALEQNLGLQIERINPQVQDIAVAHAQSSWIPTISSTLGGNRTDLPSTNAFSGGQTNTINTSLTSAIGISQTLPHGANYSASWNSARATSTNIFNSFNPQLSSYVTASVTQPLLRNFKVDEHRHDLQISRKDREATDIDLHTAIVQTTRDVRNAYWDLTYQIDNLRAQQQSLDLSKQLLSDNEKRVAAGTMASLDIVEAQSEVARNEEAVIVADAAIKQAEDRLRVLIFDPSAADFWTVSIEPSDVAPFQAREVDVDAAVRRALANRTDARNLRNGRERSDLDIEYYKNQSLPAVNAEASYTSNAVGGGALAPITTFPITGSLNRGIVSEHGFASVLGDVLTNSYPTWTVGLSVSYPLGSSASQADLARARLQSSQRELQAKNLDLQIVTQVRDAARQVQTNQKRVESARASRDLSERRLEAEQKKFAAGIETNFFVFQAQRDLSQARTNEARATADYNKSLADLEAVQEAPLTGR